MAAPANSPRPGAAAVRRDGRAHERRRAGRLLHVVRPGHAPARAAGAAGHPRGVRAGPAGRRGGRHLPRRRRGRRAGRARGADRAARCGRATRRTSWCTRSPGPRGASGSRAAETVPFFASMRADLTVRAHDRASYEAYVYGSAEVVGLMCVRAFLNEDRRPGEPVREPDERAGGRRSGARCGVPEDQLPARPRCRHRASWAARTSRAPRPGSPRRRAAERDPARRSPTTSRWHGRRCRACRGGRATRSARRSRSTSGCSTRSRSRPPEELLVAPRAAVHAGEAAGRRRVRRWRRRGRAGLTTHDRWTRRRHRWRASPG